mgnify:CR=1 FL=1
MVPVPTVAATIVRLAYEAPHDARVYHVCNPAKAYLSYSEVGEAIAAAASAAAPDSDASVAVVAMDHRAWVARVREAGEATPLAPLIDFVADPRFFEAGMDHACTNTRAALALNGPFAEIDSGVIAAYVRFLQASG